MRFGFLCKGAIVVLLVALFDGLFPREFSGAVVGAFAAAWIAGVLIGRPDVRRNRTARTAIAAAMLFAAALAYDPGPLPWAFFWCAVSMAALLPKVARFDDAWHWAARLLFHAPTSILAPLRDLRLLLGTRHTARTGPRAIAAMLALPLIGGLLFVILFASANPLIAQALSAIRLPALWRILLWVFIAACVWPSLRPHAATLRLAARLPDPEPRLPGTSLPSVLIALALFNAIFAVQNILDIAFLWVGGALPAGMSQTDYVHRGAYPLIATALIAGVMALAMLRPGSASAAHPLARRLVTLWVAQNLILVASSVLRTIDYVRTSMLTEWRIAALAWMALVALGLVLISWRILTGRSARWLINRNALAATIMLGTCAFVDLGAVAAAWNVRAGRPDRVDLCYLERVGDGALLPLIALEHRPMDPATRDVVRLVRGTLMTNLTEQQSDWTNWTLHGARRLALACARIGPTPPRPRPVPPGRWRNCGGIIEVTDRAGTP
ncbi:DUF4153 domain-containing protein [Sphingomonas montana]|uniref:DUF4153 domain-containing protein n=1 Tax=Sphingomonas montana TaxID=1843236 RepID=UPI00096CF97F|nr:DUF4173 domain-containing protein [Sphingomonas montana]